MSKQGLPFVPTLVSTLEWTNISLDKYSIVYPTNLSKKFGHFGMKVCIVAASKSDDGHVLLFPKKQEYKLDVIYDYFENLSKLEKLIRPCQQFEDKTCH